MHRKKKMRLRQREEAGLAILAEATGTKDCRIIGASEGFELVAEATPSAVGNKLKRFSMTAYTGAAIKVGYGHPVVVDIEGMQIGNQNKPILMAHDTAQIVGHTEAIETTSQRLRVSGVISGVGESAQEVVALAGNGFPWQASIGASVQKMEFVEQGESVKVNGRNFNGPIYVARQTSLGEVSFVPIGADGNTSATVSASKKEGIDMNFEAWLKAKGFDPAAISAEAKTFLKSQFDSEQNVQASATTTVTAQPKAESTTYANAWVSIEAEAKRQSDIHRLTLAATRDYPGDPESLSRLRELEARACADESVTANKFELDLIRFSRFPGQFIHNKTPTGVTQKIIEAAVCRRSGLPEIEKHFDTQTLELSETHFKRGLSLVGLLNEVAQSNGWRGMADAQSKEFLRAAFASQGGSAEFDLRAGTTGPSTYSLPNILGNIANKYMRSGFLGVDSVWSRIASKRSVNNFQTVTGVGLNASTMYKPLAPSGEIKHATLSESTYSNRASTQAIMIGISRESLINDDAGALTDMSKHIGRGAGLKINDLFWTAFLANSAFFTSGNANVSTGGGSALGTAEGAAINAAELKFINQTGADGYPISVMPKILLAPPTLANTARRWMGSQGFSISGTTGQGDGNIYQGRYQIETSPYMENSLYTGYSTAAWYLLADPNDIPVIEGVALNGRWEPTVDQAEADFNQLGIALRGFIDVGFALFEYRGGVRSAGS